MGYPYVDDLTVIKYGFEVWLSNDSYIEKDCKDFFLDLKCGTCYSSDERFARAMLAGLKEELSEKAIIDDKVRALKANIESLKFRNERRVPNRPVTFLRSQ